MNEYIELNVKKDLAELCIDCYHSLGWTILNKSSRINSVTIKLKRDRKIKNRFALCELQRKCEDSLIAIEKLEKLKTKKAIRYYLVVGILGSIFIVGSVFAFLSSMILLCIVLGLIGFIGLILGYFLNIKFLNKIKEKVNPMIDVNYDLIYKACEKARDLLN